METPMRVLKFLALFLFILIISAGIEPKEPAFGGTHPYQIGVGDSLSIMVWNEPSLDQKFVVVLPDGTISFPLIGRIRAAGYTTDGLSRLIANNLKAVFKKRPSVSVTVLAIGNNIFYIMGSVGHPGIIPFTHNITLLQALIMAGGVLTAGKEDSILVLRNGHSTKISLEDIEKGKHIENNIPIQPGDIIIVPPKTDQIFIMGEVVSPGPYFFDKGMTVMKAIIGARGFTQFASSSVKIIRENKDKTKKVIHIDIDDVENEKKTDPKEYLKPGDVIYVPQRMF